MGSGNCINWKVNDNGRRFNMQATNSAGEDTEYNDCFEYLVLYSF